MYRRRTEKLIDLAPPVPPSRSVPAVRVLRTREDLEIAQERARAFERRDTDRYQRLQSYSDLAAILPSERSVELRPLSDLHPAGSGLELRNPASGLSLDPIGLEPQ
jgi:hypothetical protein